MLRYTTKTSRLEQIAESGLRWVAIRWLDYNYIECDRIIAIHGQWDGVDSFEPIARPTGHLCDAHREMVGEDWTEEYLRDHCSLATRN